MRAPVTDPMARMLDSRPNAVASRPNSTRAIVAVKMPKLKPNVPTRKTIVNTTTRSPRRRTYWMPAFSCPRPFFSFLR